MLGSYIIFSIQSSTKLIAYLSTILTETLIIEITQEFMQVSPKYKYKYWFIMTLLYFQYKLNLNTPSSRTTNQIMETGKLSVRRLAGHPQPPGGSQRNPENWVQRHMPPSGSSCTARRFLEKSKKCEQTRIYRFYISSMTQNTSSYDSKIKMCNKNSPFWISLPNLSIPTLPNP